MLETLQEKLNFEMPENLESEEAKALFDSLCVKHNVLCKNPRSTARLIDKLVIDFINYLKK